MLFWFFHYAGVISFRNYWIDAGFFKKISTWARCEVKL